MNGKSSAGEYALKRVKNGLRPRWMGGIIDMLCPLDCVYCSEDEEFIEAEFSKQRHDAEIKQEGSMEVETVTPTVARITEQQRVKIAHNKERALEKSGKITTIQRLDIVRKKLKASAIKEDRRTKNVHFPGCGDSSDDEREAILVEVAQRRIEKTRREVETAEAAAMTLQDVDISLKDSRTESHPTAQEEKQQDYDEEDVFGWGCGIEEVRGEVGEAFNLESELEAIIDKSSEDQVGKLELKDAHKVRWEALILRVRSKE